MGQLVKSSKTFNIQTDCEIKENGVFLEVKDQKWHISDKKGNMLNLRVDYNQFDAEIIKHRRNPYGYDIRVQFKRKDK